jgi:hypothetical protein
LGILLLVKSRRQAWWEVFLDAGVSLWPLWLVVGVLIAYGVSKVA